jgi:flagellar FliL protein
MLFMVPDPAEEAEAKRSAAQADAMIDTSEASRGAQKVELDLEDAPFLEEEEEVKPEEPKPKAEVSLEQPKEEKKPLLAGRKKLIIIGAAALLVLVAAALAVKFLFFKGKSAPVPEKTAQNATKEAATATPPPAPVKPEFQVHMDPFWVEQKQGDAVRFLIVRILLTTQDEGIVKEFQAKLFPARNALFYYLKNKDVQFLADENNAEKLRSELLLVVNQYVTDGKFDSLLFEEYVVK